MVFQTGSRWFIKQRLAPNKPLKFKYWQVSATDWQVNNSCIDQVCPRNKPIFMKTKHLSSVVFMMLCFTLQAQNVKEATWLVNLGDPIKNVYDNQLNVPLIETKNSSLIALEPATGALLWKSPLDSYIIKIEAIEGTPFSLVEEYNQDTKIKKTVLLNLKDGKTIDLHNEMKGKFDSYYVVPESYDLVFYSKDPDFFLVVDLMAFAIRWNQKADFNNKPEGATAKLSKFGLLPSSPTKDVTVVMECPPISNRSGGLIFAGSGKLTNVDGTGKIIWQIDQPKKKKGGMIKTVDNRTELLVDENSDQFYILKSKNMMAVKISDGSNAWSDFYEVKGNLIVDTGGGLMPLSIYHGSPQGQGGGMFTKSKLNLVDAASGRAIWPAELELKGFVDKYRMLDDHTMAVVTFNETNSRFQIIDLAQGKFRYAEEVLLKGRVIDFLVGSDKILVATSKGLNLFESATGKDLLAKMQKFDNDADIISIYKGTMAYNIDAKNRKVYRTDLTKGVSEEIIKDYKFQANAALSKYDVLDNGNIFLASAHHMQVYSPTGALLKDQPFDYPGRGMDKFDNAMAVADKVANTMGMIEGIALSARELGVAANTGQGKQAMRDSYDLIAPELATHNIAKNQRAAEYYLSARRMKKDINAPGSFFLRRNKDANATYLSYVAKADAAVLFDIPLAADAKDPEFVIDEANGFLYYAPRLHDLNDWLFVGKKGKDDQKKTAAGPVAGYKY